MDVAPYAGPLKRAHWEMLLDADPWPEAVMGYTPPQAPDAEVFVIGAPRNPYALCVLVPIKNGFEIKNIVTRPQMRRQGMAGALIRHCIELARQRGAACVEIGTGSTGHDQIRLYESLGFKRVATIPGFFTRYPEPIIENGQLLKDMVVLSYDCR